MLDVTLSLDREAYAPGDPIVGKVVIKNIASTALVVNGRLAPHSTFAPSPFREVSFVVTDPSDADVEFGPRINRGYPKPDDFKQLMPGETLVREYAIQEYFALNSPGKYSIQAVYQNQSDPGNGTEAWKGEIESNVVSFTLET